MFGAKEFEDGQLCPLLKDTCARHKCAWYTKVVGLNPQSGQQVDKWGCAVAWLPILTIENSNQQRQTAAGIDKVANQVQRSRAEFLGALPPEAKERMIKSDVRLLEDTGKNNSTTENGDR